MKISKILLTGIIGTAIAVGLTGCQPANVQSKIRISDVNSNMQTRCEEVDMRDNDDMNEILSKYDGWRVFYISEYTTGNKFGTSGSVCFEKPFEKPNE